MERHTAQLEQLNQMSDLLQTSRDLTESSAVVARYAENLIDATGGAIFVINAERSLAEAASAWGDMRRDALVFAPGECWAIRRGISHPADDLQAELHCGHVSDEVGDYVCVPLIGNGETLGVLHLQGFRAPAGSHDHAVLATMAARAGVTLANIRLRENLFRQSIRDGLTGLYNRRYLDDALLLEERRCKRSGQSFGLMMIDLDHFKRINDAHGHEAGDGVLKKFADVLRVHTRSGDIACRYGGEEFTVVMPGATLAQSRQRADQLRTAVESEALLQAGLDLRRISVSVGVSAFPACGDSAEAVLQSADRALYEAKGNGRNRVICAAQIPQAQHQGRA
jgi:diguanylate cyclase (GGDEF)-like protein